MTEFCSDLGQCVERLLELTGRRPVVGLPIGIGKPVPLVNELYRRAADDPGIELTLLTGLSLGLPEGGSELERRFLGPFVQRVFAGVPELEYRKALRAGRLPPNVRVIEFFFEPGAALELPAAQQNYLASNYTHVARDLLARGCNVIAQLVASRGSGERQELSLGSNPDVTADLLPLIEAERRAGREILLVGEVNTRMPFMLGQAVVPVARFDLLLTHERYDHELYCPPNLPIGDVDHAIGMQASAVIRDGGTLQVGIGELGDAIVYALQLRHQQNAAWRAALTDLGIERRPELVDALGGRDGFATGLFACTEMLIDQMLDLYRSGVLRRRVFASLAVERLVAAGELCEPFDATTLQQLVDAGQEPLLDAPAFQLLQRCGIFRAACRFEAGGIRAPDGVLIAANLGDADCRERLAGHCLGRRLRGGAIAEAGFFLGPKSFYAALRDMPEEERAQFDMRGVGHVNQLQGADYELRVLQRRHARFINTTMLVTLLGAATSDTLEDGRVVGGVGGQYNFVAMAHALPDARSLLCLRATRTRNGRTHSNIVWNYAQTTIPRQLRDLVATEYGTVDLRGRTDSECIAALLGIADSRFQLELLAVAKRAGKIAAGYRIPDWQRGNYPQTLSAAFAAHRSAGRFSEFPFGTDFTTEEIQLARALRLLRERSATWSGKLRVIMAALLLRHDAANAKAIARMRLDTPRGLAQWWLAQLVEWSLRR